ncbi:pq loop repeat-containing protein [Venturia nashicola]|uniref:Pq loop repeat-containing protein n=1 Tax=Venturia nashicola TaxID=86259 RepID=A0A4Z1PVJ7_9PEZI|nr:pq loop repeat-containing protein [Venturia nashicola]
MAPQPSTPPPKIIPQIYKNWRRHSTEGVPGWMVFSWAIAMVPFGAYVTIQNLNMAIKVQPQLFCSLCLICWGQTLYYAKRYKPWQAALTILGTGASFASIQLILVFTLRIPYAKGISWPVTTLGIIGAVLINFGLIGPFIDAYKRDWRIIGVSFRFLSIDFAGAVFSLLSLCFQDTLDKEAAGSYITVMVLETGICFIQCSWLVRKWGVLREARRKGKSFDEFVGGEDVLHVNVMKSDRVGRDGGPREWSFAGVFAALNRRHGEGADIEKGGIGKGEGKHATKVITTSSATSSDESLVCQRPDPVYTPTHPPRRIQRSETCVHDDVDPDDDDEKNSTTRGFDEWNLNGEMHSGREMHSEKEDYYTCPNDPPPITRDASLRVDHGCGDGDDPDSLVVEKEEGVETVQVEKR